MFLGINKGQENYKTIIAENEAILFEENYKELYGGFDPSSPEGFIYFQTSEKRISGLRVRDWLRRFSINTEAVWDERVGE